MHFLQDENFAHFLHDVAKYMYTQTHTCGKRTNKGFTFNEGDGLSLGRNLLRHLLNFPANYSFEGNIAKALRALRSVTVKPLKEEWPCCAGEKQKVLSTVMSLHQI